MALRGACWVCDERGEGLVPLRPRGVRDGRLVCRECTARLVGWLDRRREEGLPLADERVWVPPTAPPEPEEARGEVRGLFLRHVGEALLTADDRMRASAALVWVEMDLWEEGLGALSRVAPAAVPGFNERLLDSLLSRLLDPERLAPGARETLLSLLYPAA